MSSTYVRTDFEFFNGRQPEDQMARMIGMVLSTEREGLRLHEAISGCPSRRSVRRILKQVIAEKRRQISHLERAMALCGARCKEEYVGTGARVARKLEAAQSADRFSLVSHPSGGLT